jgi:hypothetical protein
MEVSLMLPKIGLVTIGAIWMSTSKFKTVRVGARTDGYNHVRVCNLNCVRANVNKTFLQLILVFFLFVALDGSPAAASDVGDGNMSKVDAFVREHHGQKVLLFTADIATIVAEARTEAERQGVDLNKIAGYMVIMGKDRLRVSLGPQSSGGLDGPEFWVEFRRADLKMLEVKNELR